MGLDNGIFDAHVHIWTSDTERYPLAPGFTARDTWTPSFTADELLSHTSPSGVDKINLVQMTWYGLDHSYILDVIAGAPERFCGTGMVPAVNDVTLADQGEAMAALSRGGIYAFRVRGKSARPGINDGPQWMDHPGYSRMFEAGAQHNLAISFLLNVEDLQEVERMCARYPGTPVIIDHLARSHAAGPVDDRGIQALCRMARHRNVMVKVGAFYAGGRTPPYTDLLPALERVIDAFGPERCMWESDSPLQLDGPHRYDDSVALIRDHADFLSASDKEQVLSKTAQSFFFDR